MRNSREPSNVSDTSPRYRGPDRRRVPGSGPLPAAVGTERRQSNDRRRSGFISRIQLFSGIPYGLVERTLVECPMFELGDRQVLLSPGEHNDAIYVLLDGELRIHLDERDSDDYIAVEPGGCVGELSIIDGKPVSAFVVSAGRSRVLVIQDSTFWESLTPVPGVARNLLASLSERMRENNHLILQRMQDRLALEQLQKDMQVASRIQASMLPSRFPLFPDRHEFDLFAFMDPAREVGGDFYDAFLITPGRLFVAIGDVSGKGVGAALFMARSMTQLRMEAMRGALPGKVLSRVNEALCEGNDAGMFVTLFCGVLDLTTGELVYSNGGHNPPLAGGGNSDFAFLPVPRGMVVGMIEGSPYTDARIRLQPGQTLFVYTDGVTEALDPQAREFSDERLVNILSANRGLDPKPMSDLLRSSIAEFAQGAQQSDDITVLALRYAG